MYAASAKCRVPLRSKLSQRERVNNVGLSKAGEVVLLQDYGVESVSRPVQIQNNGCLSTITTGVGKLTKCRLDRGHLPEAGTTAGI